MVSLELSNGLRVQVTARAVGRGIDVQLTTQPNVVTEVFDQQFKVELARYEVAAAEGAHHHMSFPPTGAEALLIELEIRDSDGCLPPHSVVRWSGGSQTPWSVSWRSPDWQPRTVLLTGLGSNTLVEVESA